MGDSARWLGGTARAAASPEEAWAAWTDPPCWVGGPIAEAELHGGEFAVGARYTTRIEGERRRLTATITEMDAPRVWTSLAKAPGLTMTIEHRIDPDGDGVLLTERLRFGGPLGPVVSRLMRRRLERTFADTTAHAARVVEARRS